MPQTVTIAEAARILGIHRRTVERRIKSGEIATVTAAGRRMVVLGAEPSSEPLPQSDATPPRQDDDTSTAPDAALMAELRARIADLETDRDHWRETAADLRRNLSEVTGTLYALRDSTRALPAPEPTKHDNSAHRPLRRAWWRFWQW